MWYRKAAVSALAATTLSACAAQKNKQDQTVNMTETANKAESADMNTTKAEANIDETYLTLSDAQQQAVEATNDFTLNLFRTQAGHDSRVLSPVSVAYLMGMLANGAEGGTHQEIMNTLCQSGASLPTLNETYKALMSGASTLDPQTQVNIANCIAVNRQVTLKNDYAEAMQSVYKASVESLDFGSPKTLAHLNGWCSKQTNGMIPKIVDQLDADATAVLMNAIYFNGNWTEKFDKNQTKTENFRGYTCDVKQVPMMHQQHKFSYAERADYAAVTLPYGNGAYAMTVVLPNEGYSTADIAKTLTADSLASLSRSMEECMVDLKMPRFSTTTETSLNKPISQLGAPTIFEAGRANFSRMSDVSMCVSEMLQKAKIEVSEKGTKAAAVTAAVMMMASLEPDEPRRVSFHADRPFIYMIVERSSGAIFFIGQYAGPEE